MDKIRFKRLENGWGLPLPHRKTKGSSGMDICAAEPMNIRPGTTKMIQTGFAVAVPEGYELQCRSRSGLASKGIVVANSPGTIDADYRGELKVLLTNTNSEGFSGMGFEVDRGDRIAQLVLCKVPYMEVEEVDELDETSRGSGGFGSTGVK